MYIGGFVILSNCVEEYRGEADVHRGLCHFEPLRERLKADEEHVAGESCGNRPEVGGGLCLKLGGDVHHPEERLAEKEKDETGCGDDERVVDPLPGGSGELLLPSGAVQGRDNRHQGDEESDCAYGHEEIEGGREGCCRQIKRAVPAAEQRVGEAHQHARELRDNHRDPELYQDAEILHPRAEERVS